ncbi:hypothetical protein C8F04DRAFT_1404613 [Mycena alexandri]|uniref:Uncharacterized protein n=1 Tax=Mycena alexandri TaxID=1745969 RepID=A0AAD6S0D8_9AGAR|nr:hypothetical protein C8F04DRAFT_1404613 [Mycena alexandri]
MATLGLTDVLTHAVRASAEMQTELANLKCQLHEASVKAVAATTMADEKSRTVDELVGRVRAEIKKSGAAMQERDTIGAELRRCEGRCVDERRARIMAQDGRRKAEKGRKELEAASTASEEQRNLAHNARRSAEQEDKEQVLQGELERDELCKSREALRVEKEGLYREHHSLTALLERALYEIKAGLERRLSPGHSRRRMSLTAVDVSANEAPHKRAKREDNI